MDPMQRPPIASNDQGPKPQPIIMMDDTDRAAKRAQAWQDIQNACAAVVNQLGQDISDRMMRRKPIEERWLEDLRQFHGRYDTSVDEALKADKERSAVFINITRTKTNAWIARLHDMLFPNDERNWGIDPTPVPELTREAREMMRQAEEAQGKADEIVGQHNADVEAGGPGIPDQLGEAQQYAQTAADMRKREAENQKIIEEARKRCDAMQREIDDQLTEARYPSRARDVIEDGCKVGCGVIKGPSLNTAGRQSWEGEGTDYTLGSKNDIRPGFRRVSYWHFFPDDTAENMEECEDVFERHLPNKKMLRRMAKEIGFDPAAVREMLREGPQHNTGSSSDLNFMRELRLLDETATTAGDVIADYQRRYVVWEWHGALEAEDVAKMVRALGRFDDAERLEEEADPLETMMVRVFFSNNRLLRIEEDYLFDSGSLPYSVFTFEKSEASILGSIGVPRMMKHEQHMLNSAVRMMMDNSALAVAPQLVIDKEQIEPENNSWRLTPRKIWKRIKSMIPGAGQQVAPAFELHPIPINQALLASIIEIAVKFVDEAVAMPLIAQGEQGAHVTRTSSGMAMLFNSANVNFRRVVKSWDDNITAPVITRTYDFNMQFSDKPEIKGDMRAEARGTSVLLVREVQADQLMTILREWSDHPIMGVGFRAYHCMRMVLQAMSINPDDLLIPEEEYLQKLKDMSESAGQDDSEQIKAQTALEIANIDAQARLEVAGINKQIAEVRAQTEFARLANDRDISLNQIEAMFRTAMVDTQAKVGMKQIEVGSKERALAAEIAVEERNARAARAMGENPTGSGGAISMGSLPGPGRV